MEGGIDMGGIAYAMSADSPMYRKQAFRPAEPLEEHVLQSLAFLARVDTVALISGDKKNFEFTVRLHADPQDATATPATFTIRRSAQEIDRVSQIVQDACCRHFDLKAYNIPPCALCEPFKAKVELPVSTKDRLFHSAQQIQSTMEQRVVALVMGARVPPTNEKLFCEGVTRVPAAVTKFLLLGVDQTKL